MASLGTCVYTIAFLTASPLVTSFSMASAGHGYKAAVYAYRTIIFDDVSVSRFVALENTMKNLAVYRKQAEEAARQGADIIVFPEYGLYGMTLSRDVIRPYLEPVPDPWRSPPWVPCLDPARVTPSDVLTHLSCIARNNSIFLVANVGDIQPCDVTSNDVSMATPAACPQDGRFQFNTNVVFDNTGMLIARYHKRSLFGEKQFDAGVTSTGEAERITFDTPFGRFGTFICFDILFHDPAVILLEQGVKNVVFPTAWMNSYPMLVGAGFHASWARRHGVNLLVANLHRPEFRFDGSGVYLPSGPLAFYSNSTPGSGGQLILAQVPASDVMSSQAPARKESGPRKALGPETKSGSAADTAGTAREMSPNASYGNIIDYTEAPQYKTQLGGNCQSNGSTGVTERQRNLQMFQKKIRGDTFLMTPLNLNYSPSGKLGPICMDNTCCFLAYSANRKSKSVHKNGHSRRTDRAHDTEAAFPGNKAVNHVQVRNNKQIHGHSLVSGVKSLKEDLPHADWLTQTMHFAFGVFQGVHRSKKDWYFEACLLVPCHNGTSVSCGEVLTGHSATVNVAESLSFTMSGRFSEGAASHVYPQVLVSDTNLQHPGVVPAPPDSWAYSQQDTCSTLFTSRDLARHLAGATLYARDYARDPGRPSSSFDSSPSSTSDPSLSFPRNLAISMLIGVLCLP